jgi:hypothetical protein
VPDDQIERFDAWSTLFFFSFVYDICILHCIEGVWERYPCSTRLRRHKFIRLKQREVFYEYIVRWWWYGRRRGVEKRGGSS